MTLTAPHDASLLGLSFVHQELALVPRTSIAENVFLGLPQPKRAGIFVDWRGTAPAAPARCSPGSGWTSIPAR